MVKTFDYPLLNSCWVEDIAIALLSGHSEQKVSVMLRELYRDWCEANFPAHIWAGVYAEKRNAFVAYCLEHKAEIVACAVV